MGIGDRLVLADQAAQQFGQLCYALLQHRVFGRGSSLAGVGRQGDKRRRDEQHLRETAQHRIDVVKTQH